MDYPKYEGNYLGIVVQNNDPLRQGRVKVFVPHISPTVYQNWATTQNKDLAFKFVGLNINSDLTNILDDLKTILPWAPLAMPITGEMASGRYNDTTKNASTSDSSWFQATQFSLSAFQEAGANWDGTGEKPGAIFDQNAFQLYDAFYNPAETNANNVNKLAYNYKPETYSNLAKGTFGIPRVGAHVWVFFNQGDPLKPVVFAAAYGASDWQGIYDVDFGTDLGQDYPGEYENFNEEANTSTSSTSGRVTPSKNHTINTDTYRNKYVINQKGGTLQFVNTDNREMLKFTHYSGSFKEFNNQANIEFAANNDQKLVTGDSFDTVRGSRNVFTQFDSDNITFGDVYRKVGDLSRVKIYDKWKSIMDDIADTKQLFEIMRCNPVQGIPSNSLFKLNSKKQEKSGQPAPCPVCTAMDQGGIDFAVNNRFPQDPKNDKLNVSLPVHSNKTGLGTGQANATGLQLAHYVTQKGFPVFGQDAAINVIGASPGIPTQLKDQEGNAFVQGPGYLAAPLTKAPGIPCPVCNQGNFAKIGADNRPGLSPSSFAGFWTPDIRKKGLPLQYDAVLPQLAALEAAMGTGGTEIVEIEKNKIESIGLTINDWGAIRVDPLGKLDPAQVQVFPGYTRTIPAPSPLIEVVQVDDLPGGTYTLNVANRYSMLVGAGGINMKSYGVVNISGAMSNIAGEQINIGSALETNIDGGKRLNLTADIISIKQRTNQQVLVDSDLGVTGQTIIKGALYVEGPVFVHELNRVGKVHTTDLAQVQGANKKAASPPTPSGVMITSDTAHMTVDPEDGVVIGANPKIPTYMGYTDTARAAAVMPENMFIGVAPAGAQLQVTLGGLPEGLQKIVGSVLNVTLSLNQALPVVAKKNVTQANILASGINATSVTNITPPMLSITDVSALPQYKTVGDTSTLVKAIGGPTATLGAYIPGAGYGDPIKQENLPLRGLPTVQRAKIMALFSPPAYNASLAPGVVFGDGSDADAHLSAPSQFTYMAGAETYNTTNAGLRMKFMDQGNVPSAPGHFTNRNNYDQTELEGILPK